MEKNSSTQQSITKLAHEWASDVLHAGDWAIDATCGNGHDTLFLAQKVGETGHVAAFDIQPEAIEATRTRLRKNNVPANTELFCSGHENMLSVLGDCWRGRASAIFFNLGYLPNSNHSVTTRGDTTLRALTAAMELLASHGLISIAVYTKHPGGFEESARVDEWLKSVPAEFTTRLYNSHNPTTPWLVQLHR